ncbi:MAG: hypothetical protein QOF18_2833, partial [Frankiaceae bacterium]|nr:hypothetical protein [Frankiaceae bacterium]
MKPMMATFGHPTRPRTISYRSIDPSWSQWGWSVSLTRTTTQQFSSLQEADASGFVLQGSGKAEVTTPPGYDPGARMRVHVSGAGTADTQVLTVNR